MKSGVKVLLISTPLEDIADVRSARDMPGVIGFDEELKREASRKRRHEGVVEPPKGKLFFLMPTILRQEFAVNLPGAFGHGWCFDPIPVACT